MRNKRALGLLVILIVVSLLGVGYALNTKDLTISGTAKVTATDDNFTVRFKKTEEGTYQEPTDMVNAEGKVTSDTEATISVTGLSKVNDEATVTYTVENASNGIDADVLAKINATNPEYFKVEVTGISTEASAKTKIVSGEETTVTVKVKLLKTPIVDQTADVTVTLTAEAVAQ